MTDFKPSDRATVVLNAPTPQYFHVTVLNVSGGCIFIQPKSGDAGIPETYDAETGKALFTGIYEIKPYMHQQLAK